MKVLFIYMGAENLGVEYLVAGARAAGHHADLAFDPSVFGGHLMWDIPSLARILDMRPAIIRKIIKGNYDVAAFSCFSANYQWALTIAREVRKAAPGVRTVFGGVHVTAVPERVISEPAVDALITGEADTILPGLLTDWENSSREGNRPGVWEKIDGEVIGWNEAPPAAEVESLPFPAKDIFYEKCPALRDHYSIMASRGCPYNCTYCNSSRFSRYGRFDSPAAQRPVRQRSVGSVMAELENAIQKWRPRMVIFRDDVFNIMRKSWFVEFAAEYRKKIGLPYYCWTYPSAVSEDNAKLLKESGCAFISMGVESADEEKRAVIMKRRYSNDRVRAAVDALKKQGITVSLDHITGFPGDTPETLLKAVEFFNELRPARLQSYCLVYLPGTELLNNAVEENLLSQAERESIEEGNVGFLFSNPGGPLEGTALRKFIIMFSLIPLLPRGWVSFLLRRKAYRWFSGAVWVNNLVVFLSAVKLRDPLFLYLLRFLLSRKRVP